MATTSTTITPADGWVSVFTATEDVTISVEKNTGNSSAVLAIDVATPTLPTGHCIRNGELKNASLLAGESLFVSCTDSLLQDDINVFVITG
ncbi:TPA: hypothetical protein ACOEAK_003161 [Enterobacter ludwigii]